MSLSHPRVHHGSNAQYIAQAHLTQSYDSCVIKSIASLGSHAPDITAVVNGVDIQCEVKNSVRITSPVVTINKTVKRGNINIIDELVPVITGGIWDSIEEAVDYHRLTDTTIGFPGDAGTPTSGKLPKCLKITNAQLLRDVRESVITNLVQHQDTYFIMVCHRPTPVLHVFYTGYGHNVLNAPPLPQLSMAKLRTYGNAKNGSMRVALKVSFIPPPSR